MEIGARHWLVAIAVAGLLHAALVTALTTPPARPPMAVAVTIDLAASGGRGGDGNAGAPLAGEVVAPVESPSTARALAPLAAKGAEVGHETVVAQEVVAPRPARTVPTNQPAPAPKRQSEPNPQGERRAETKPRAMEPASPAGAEYSAGSRSANPAGASAASAGSGQPAGRGAGAGGAQGPGAVGNYYGQLAAWLNRHKRYPRHARRRHQEGTVKVVFTIDRRGQLLSHRIVESSGYPLLDDEVGAMLRRAAPLPALPAEIRQAQLTITVPITFALR